MVVEIYFFRSDGTLVLMQGALGEVYRAVAETRALSLVTTVSEPGCSRRWSAFVVIEEICPTKTSSLPKPSYALISRHESFRQFLVRTGAPRDPCVASDPRDEGKAVLSQSFRFVEVGIFLTPAVVGMFHPTACVI